MIDYRLKENRMQLLKDYYWFHTKYKIHPGLVYLYLPEMCKNMNQEDRYWVAFLEGCIQNPNTVYAILQYFPHRPYTEEEVKEFEEFHNYVYDKLEYDTDRIHYKGQLVKQLIKYNELIGESSVKVFEKDLYDKDPKKWFENVFEFILNKVWGFGRMSAWSYTEFIKICCNLNYEFSKYYMTEHDSSLSMRNGLLLLYGYDELHIWKKLPYSPKKHSKELMQWADIEVKALEEYLKTQYTDIKVTAETLESILCAFKNTFRGRRYPNIYTDMSYDRIKKAELLWGDKVDFSFFWNIRKDNLPKELLKEYDYNNYIIENNISGVNEDKCMYFVNTGQPLYLGLFFDKYNKETINFLNKTSKIVEKKIINNEIKDTISEKGVQKLNKVNIVINKEDIINKIKNSYNIMDVKLTKEEKSFIKKNYFKTQKLQGSSIFNNFSFNENWESKIYDLTPIELKTENNQSMYFKREDYFAPLGYGGINGAKLRQALYLGQKQVKDKDWDLILTGATSISPQLPITCAIAKYYNLSVKGLSSRETSDMLEISRGFGGEFEKTKIAYNTYVQQQMQLLKEKLESEGKKPFMFKYGLTIDLENSSDEDILGFYNVGANQVKNLSAINSENLIIALGSSNSATAVMFGLMKEFKNNNIKNLHLIGVGPNTYNKLIDKLNILSRISGIKLEEVFNFGEEIKEGLINVIYYDVHKLKLWEYSDKIYEKFEDIDFHYTYEAKMFRFIRYFLPHLINQNSCFWIIGSGLDKNRLKEYYNK